MKTKQLFKEPNNLGINLFTQFVKKRFCILMIGLLLPLGMSAQEEPVWQLLAQQDGVDIYYAIETCSSTEKLCLKAFNSNAQNVVTQLTLVTNNDNTVLEHPLSIVMIGNEEFLINCENPGATPAFLDVTINSPDSFSCTIQEITTTVLN